MDSNPEQVPDFLPVLVYVVPIEPLGYPATLYPLLQHPAVATNLQAPPMT